MIPKSYLSYSNGSNKIEPYKFRPVISASNHFSFIYSNFSDFSRIINNDPLIITCYPSSLGFIDGFSVVDTYLRTNTFNQAIKLATLEKKPVIIIGQPLITTHLILSSIESGLEMPAEVGIALGGYYCPVSLEKFLKNKFEDQKVSIIYGYGVAEVEFGCLIGSRVNSEDPIYYQLSSPDIKLKIAKESSELILQKKDEAEEFRTGDLIEEISTNEEKKYIITQDPNKMSPGVKKELNSWTDTDWNRKTGYLRKSDNRIIYQLRPGHEPENDSELEFHDFMRQFSMNWYDKPDWCIPN